MEKKLNNKSLAFGVPGIIIQTIGLMVSPILTLIGSVLLITGLCYYNKAKGHHWAFGFFGLLSWLGIIVLIALKDKCVTQQEQEAKKTTKLKDVVLGILFGLGLVIGVPVILALIFMLFSK